MAGRSWRYSIRIGVVAIFVIATALTASIAIGLQYYFSYQQSLNAAKVLYWHTAEQTADFLEGRDQKARSIALSFARYPQLAGEDGQVPASTLRLFAQTLSLNPGLYAMYLGFDNGRFYELINLEAHPLVPGRLDAPDNARWLMAIKDNNSTSKQLIYLDPQLRIVQQRSEDSSYDPRTRPWYQQASSEQVFQTAPYIFDSLDAPGRTYSLRLGKTPAVLGLDVTLDAITDHLMTLPVAMGTELYLHDQQGRIIASNAPSLDSFLPQIEPLSLSEEEKALVAALSPLRVSNELDWAPVDFSISGKPHGYAIDLLTLISQMTGLPFQYVNGHSWPTLVQLYQEGNIDILQPILRNENNASLGRFSQPFLNLPFAFASRSDQSGITHLSQLKGKTLAVGEDWSIIPVIEQEYPQITLRQYPGTADALRAVLNMEADAAIDNAAILRFVQRQYFLDGLAIMDSADTGLPANMGELFLLVHPDQQPLQALLNKALAAIPAEAHTQLEKKWLDDNQAFSRFSGTLPYPSLLAAQDPQGDNALQEFEDSHHHYYVFSRPFANDTDLVFSAVAPASLITGPARENAIWAAGITTLCILVLLPMAGLFAAPIVNPIKRLEAETHKVKDRQYQLVQRVPTRIVETEKLSASLYAMAQSIRQHEKNQEALMESFIELIAQAIDEKSAYTGAHCARVPELGMMLAEAASSSDEKPFQQFSLEDERKRREFRIAAWLHDCGKITTPEHIVDKGAKLEANYNRIHEIRTRFEVLLRDADIEYLKSTLAHPEKQTELDKQWQARRDELQEQFRIVAEANVGGEFLRDEDKDALRRIGAQTWLRHFDDRLGLSPLDARRLGPGASALPVSEPLLADKPEHLIPHEHPPHYPEHLGITLSPPQFQANLGELYNLLIDYGTLTAEDRFKINEHIINTIRMLDKLPFPDELAKVPQYASTHHERLDGQGYPRGLSKAQLEIPDRILAVADVFEALTASDRPYKTAKTVSESLGIMKNMVAQGHLDGDVFRLMLLSGVISDYAQQHLSADQLDVHDFQAFLPDSDSA